CNAHPEEATPALLRCFDAAKSKNDLEQCEDNTEPEEPAHSDEAADNLNALKKLLKAQFADYASFVPGDAPLTPDAPCCEDDRSDRRCNVDESQWLGVWADLGFSIDEPHFYQYAYSGTEDAFTAI